MNDNVVSFPLKNPRRDMDDVALGDDFEQKVQLIKRVYYSKLAGEISSMAFSMMDSMLEPDCDFDSITQKDMILVKEAIAAFMLKSVGIDHPLHQAAEVLVNIDDITVDDQNETDELVYSFNSLKRVEKADE